MNKLAIKIIGVAFAAFFVSASIIAQDKNDNGGAISLRGTAQLYEQ